MILFRTGKDDKVIMRQEEVMMKIAVCGRGKNEKYSEIVMTNIHLIQYI